GDGKTEVLIDRPEPDAPVLLDVEVTSAGNFFLTPLIRTRDVVRTQPRLLSAIGDYRGRLPVLSDSTHLEVRTLSSLEGAHWSIRFLPLSAAPSLAPEHRGRGDEVLRYEGGPALATVQFRRSDRWTFTFLCGCLREPADCACSEVAWPDGTPGGEHPYASGGGDSRETLRLPRAGYVLVEEKPGADAEEGPTWYVTTEPLGLAPPAPPHPGTGRPGR
ncbi:hypothetical protein, partial [Streptomyces sp. SPB074]|uniref:hypothetical protein n=1 Tax=Streptomyces sp. (strain SPB074) TaxID=465543 RepID=UPI00056B95BA